jgi:hypothetical protein
MRRLSELKSHRRNFIREAKTFESSGYECAINTWTLDYFFIETLLEKNHRYESVRQDLATKFLSVLVKHIS